MRCPHCGGPVPVDWRALRRDRSARMLALRDGGETWAEVGAAFGIGGSAAYRAVQRYRQRKAAG